MLLSECVLISTPKNWHSKQLISSFKVKGRQENLWALSILYQLNRRIFLLPKESDLQQFVNHNQKMTLCKFFDIKKLDAAADESMP